MDILRAILLSLESMIEDPELQVNGFVLIIDWSNFTFKQASKLTPSMLRLAIEGLQVSQGFYFAFEVLQKFLNGLSDKVRLLNVSVPVALHPRTLSC